MSGRVKLIILLFVLLTFSGCTMLAPSQYPIPPRKPSTERPEGTLPPSTRPTYNLMGYPQATRDGYIDGCETAKKSEWAFKDQARYMSDGQYRTGWDDGFFICSSNR